MGIIWLPWDFLEKTGIEKFLCLQHSFPPFCRYLEIIPNFLLFDWALGFIHTKYYRCHYTSSTLNFKNIERGVKLLTGRNTRCLLCSSTSCLCSTWNGKVLWTGYLFVGKSMSPIEVSNYFSVDEWQTNQLKVEDVSECKSYQSFSPWKQL